MKLRRILAGLWIVLLLLAGTCYAENSDNPIVARTEYGYLRLNIPSVKKVEYYGRYYIECSYSVHQEINLPYGIPIVEDKGTYYCWFDPLDDKMHSFGKKHYDASKDYIYEYLDKLDKRDISGNSFLIYSYILGHFPRLRDEVKSDNQKADEKYGEYLDKALDAHANKDWKTEYNSLKQAYDKGCQSQGILRDLAESAWKSGDYDTAIEWAGKRIEMNPSGDAYNTRAWWYYLLGQNDKALEDAEWAVFKDKNKAYILDTRGCIYYELGQYDKAIADFNAAIKLDDKYAHAYFYRSKCYEAQGNKDKSTADYKKAKKYDNEIIDDKTEFANQQSQIVAKNQLAHQQKLNKYKDTLKKLNDAVYVHNNAANFPTRVVFENDDIIITVTGNIKNNESEQFYQELIPQEVRTNYESGVYQQQYNQLKAQVEAEQATQQAVVRDSIPSGGNGLGVPVTVNYNPNSIQWSGTAYRDEYSNVYRQEQIGDHLYLVRKQGTDGKITYGMRSTDHKYYMVQYDYSYDGRTEHCYQIVENDYYSDNSFGSIKDLGYEYGREPNIMINYVEDISAACKFAGEFNETSCKNTVTAFFDKVHDRIKDTCYSNAGAYYPSCMRNRDDFNNDGVWSLYGEDFSVDGIVRNIKVFCGADPDANVYINKKIYTPL